MYHTDQVVVDKHFCLGILFLSLSGMRSRQFMYILCNNTVRYRQLCSYYYLLLLLLLRLLRGGLLLLLRRAEKLCFTILVNNH